MPNRKYTGNSDGVSRVGARPGITRFVELAQKRGFSNMGTFSNRQMNNPAAKKNDPKFLSVHATGRACDIGYKDRNQALVMWDFLMANTRALGIEEIHDYAFDANLNDKELGWGRGYRCSRGEGNNPASVRIYDASNNAGSQGGRWLHVELNAEMADDARKFTAAWRSCNPPPAIS
jgi:hypothetical protein